MTRSWLISLKTQVCVCVRFCGRSTSTQCICHTWLVCYSPSLPLLKKKKVKCCLERVFFLLWAPLQIIYSKTVLRQCFSLRCTFLFLEGLLFLFLAPGTAKNVCTEQLDTETNAWLDAAEVSGPSWELMGSKITFFVIVSWFWQPNALEICECDDFSSVRSRRGVPQLGARLGMSYICPSQ